MDINCGAILDGDATVAAMGQQIFQAVLHTASGRPTKSEILGIGKEIVPEGVRVLEQLAWDLFGGIVGGSMIAGFVKTA